VRVCDDVIFYLFQRSIFFFAEKHNFWITEKHDSKFKIKIKKKNVRIFAILRKYDKKAFIDI